MAVHDLGYRGWDGQLVPTWHRPMVIAGAGIRRALQGRLLRRLLLFAWAPAMWFAFGFLMWEQALLNPEVAEVLEPFLVGAPESLESAVRGGFAADDPIGARHGAWSWLLLTFFRNPQGVIMVLLVGVIAPPLISQDIRSRAFLLYFSKPLARMEYLLGKFITVWFYLAAISTMPALVLYMLGVLLSPHLVVVYATWDLPLRILAASVVLSVPTAALALCLSSMTQESRYAAFGWFAIWVLGWFTYATMNAAEAMNQRGDFMEAQSKWSHVSLAHVLGRVQGWIFGFESFHDVKYAVLILVVLTVVSVLVLAKRVMAPMRQ